MQRPGPQRSSSPKPASIPQAQDVSPLRRIAAWTSAAVVLALVFAAYLNPHLMVDLAARVWACF